MKYFFAVIACLSVIMLGCQPGDKNGEPQSADETVIESKIIYHHHADPTGEVFAYMYLPDFDPEAPPEGDMGNGMICLASIPSGDKFVEYETTDGIVVFSPDGKYVLKLLPKGKEPRGQFEFVMAKTSDDAELWRKVVGSEGEVPPIDFIWDESRDMVIGISAILAEEPKIEDIEERTKALLKAPQLTFLRAYRISDGELLGEAKVELVFLESMDFAMSSRYGGGKLFVVAMDDPFAEVRDTSEENIYLFTIEPITWETEMIDTQGFFSTYPRGNLFVTEEGDKLFFQSSIPDPDNMPAYPGNDIIEIDLNTGELNTLLECSTDYVYELVGITPDGQKILCYEISEVDDIDLAFQPVVLDVPTGEILYIEQAVEDGGPPRCQISASGRYVTESYMGDDVWVHDLETGELTVMATIEENPELFNVPGIIGPYNQKF